AGIPWLADYYRRFNQEVNRFFLDSAYREELMSLGVNSEKLVEIKGAVDFRAAQAAAASRDSHRRSVREELGMPATSLIGLAVGRLHHSKGHQYALEALAKAVEQVTDLHWIVLGEGELRETLETRARDLGISEHVHILGFREETYPYYAAA